MQGAFVNALRIICANRERLRNSPEQLSWENVTPDFRLYSGETDYRLYTARLDAVISRLQLRPDNLLPRLDVHDAQMWEMFEILTDLVNGSAPQFVLITYFLSTLKWREQNEYMHAMRGLAESCAPHGGRYTSLIAVLDALLLAI